MREGREGGVLGRTYCIQSQMTTMVCVVWTHVSDCHTAQRSLAAHSCGDGCRHRSSMLLVGAHGQLYVVGGHLWLLGLHPRGHWASVGAGGHLLPCVGIGVASSSLFVVHHGRPLVIVRHIVVVVRCHLGSFHAVKQTPRGGMQR